MKETKAKSKRNFMIINLIQTPTGYSVIQGIELLNKPVSQPQPTLNQIPTLPPMALQPHSSLPVPQSAPKQASKMTIKQNNLLFLKAPTNFHPSSSPPSLPTPSASSYPNFAPWYTPTQVHQIQKKQVLSWLGEWGYVLTQEQAVSWIEKYQQHRNLIIQIYLEGFAKNCSYLSASVIRKYLCEDARWLMKIHIFLTSWGLINSTKINMDNQNTQFSANLLKLTPTNNYKPLNLDSAYYSQSPKQCIPPKSTQSYITLKKVTESIRPYCDYCGIHCQIVWFQHTRVMDPKQISTIMKNVNSKNPPLSEKQYQIILCTKCYCNGNFPLLLTHHDFRKVTINDQLEPGKKKKSRKAKRKDKKIKIKEKNMDEEEEYKEDADDPDDEAKLKDNKDSKDKQQKIDEQQNNSADKQKQESNKAKQVSQLNGTKDHNNNKPPERSSMETQKQATVDQMIDRIISSAKKPKAWSLQQTSKLLQLISKHGEQWDTIHTSMQKWGYCNDSSPEDIISYFVSLPQANISALQYQNSNQCFINENKSSIKSSLLIKKVQKNFDNAARLAQQIEEGKGEAVVEKSKGKTREWEGLFTEMIGLEMKKIDSRILGIQELGNKALKLHRKFEEATRNLGIEGLKK